MDSPEHIKLEVDQILKVYYSRRPDKTNLHTAIGRLIETYDDHLLLNCGADAHPLAVQPIYYDRIEGYERLPDVNRWDDIMATARLHYDSGADSWEEGDYQAWSVGACVQDVRKLLAILEVSEAMRDNGVF